MRVPNLVGVDGKRRSGATSVAERGECMFDQAIALLSSCTDVCDAARALIYLGEEHAGEQDVVAQHLRG